MRFHNGKKIILYPIKLGITIGLVVLLIDRVDWEKVGEHLVGISWPLLFGYVVLQFSSVVISARKWQIIAAHKKLSFSMFDGFFTYLSGSFINNFLPSTIGGDAYRAYWLAKRTEAKAASLSTVVFDRFIGLWTTAILALGGSILLFLQTGLNGTLVTLWSVLVMFLLVDAFVTYAYRQPWFSRFRDRLPFRLSRLIGEIDEFTEKNIWTWSSLYSALFAFIGVGLNNLLLFWAIGSPMEPAQFFSVIFLIVIVSSVPLSINNIGIKEWAYITFFGLVGANVEEAVTVALLSRFIQMLLSFFALPYYISNRDGERGRSEEI